MRNLLFAIVAMALFPIATMAADDSVRCPETGIRVAGWNTDERDSVCRASAAAIAFLRAAGVPYHGEGLTIEPMPPGSGHEDQPMIGCCNAPGTEILILTYDQAVAASHRFPPAFDVPMNRALWESFISHETAHAVAEQNFAGGVPRSSANEYIAAVVQLATLPDDLRTAILDRYHAQGFAAPREISMSLYELNPAVFAVMAYRHYAALGDRGPAFIARLLREGLDQ